MAAHAELKRRAALSSIAASALLTLAKLVAGLMSGSLALMSEAAHGLLDTGATILTYFAIRAADKPADDEHHYGHGKIEAVAALAQTALLLALAIWVLVEAMRRLGGLPAPVDATWLTFTVLIVSIAVDVVRWLSLSRIARETRSDALAADALHFSSDLVSSSLVLLGLVATEFGFLKGDALAAIGVALFIAVAGFRLGRATIDTLTDTAPKGLAAQIGAAAGAVPGVVAVEGIRVRPAGAQTQGEVGIAVSRTLPLDQVAAIKEQVVNAIHRESPEVSVTVTAHPRALDDETVIESVLLISAMRRLPVHHITLQDIGGRRSVSLDVELDGRMSLGAAHEIASALEAAIRVELGPDIEVETHIEPLESEELSGVDASPGQTAAIAQALARRAAEDGVIRDVHSVRVRQSAAGLVVNYHCRVDPALTVEAVHAQVDALDRKARLDFPRVLRIFGHAEPMRPNP